VAASNDQLTTADGNEMVLEVLTDFLTKAAGIASLDEIHTAADYVAPFLSFPATYELPKVTKYKSKEAIESHYEDFLAYQTHNARNLDFFSMTQ
jgi:hypothetical protein